MGPSIETLSSWYEQRKDELVADYLDFLKIPSVSTDPAYAEGVRRAAEWVKGRLERSGFEVAMWETRRHPVVFGEKRAGKGVPTVLIYHHYDVQPVDPIEKWRSPPFEPIVKEGEVYARGASDNKGQCFYTLAALEAVGDLPLNIKVFVEGEEECGSGGALQMLKEKGDLLKADYVLVMDSGLPGPNMPAITLGLRGIMELEVRLQNSDIDLHSGVHGGVTLNPNRALVQLLAQCWDATGKVTIPGFYDEVVAPTQEEVKEIYQEIDSDCFKQAFGIRAFQGEGNYSLWESNAIRPTFEINGIAGGYAGAGFKTVIPAEAVAKISCRLVPDQKPEKVGRAIEQFLKERAPKGVRLTVTYAHGGLPVRTSSKTKLAQLCSAAYEEVFRKPCLKIWGGASIPLVADLERVVHGDVAIMGVALDTDDIHAPNEHFGLDRLKLGFLMMGRVLGELGC